MPDQRRINDALNRMRLGGASPVRDDRIETLIADRDLLGAEVLKLREELKARAPAE